MIKEAAYLTIEDLTREVERLLQSLGLHSAQSDHRVSPTPDARTIRYYTSLGLLDRPVIERRQARYGQRHVLQLVVIKALQHMTMPLAEIQQRLYGRSNEELESILSALKKEVASRDAVPPQVTNWREVILQPGLKLVALDNMTVDYDEETLVEQFRAALAALSKDHNK